MAADTPDQTIDKIYGPQFARVKATPDTHDDLELAANIANDARSMQADKAVQLALFHRAMNMAVSDPEGGSVAESITVNLVLLKVGAEAQAWQDLLDLAQAAIRQRNLGTDEKMLPAFYGWQLQLVRALLEADAAAAAEKQLTTMAREATALKQKYLADQATLLLGRVRFEAPFILAAKTAQLRVTGDDSKQNLQAGEAILAQTGDWVDATPYLVKSKDVKWNLILNLHIQRKASNRSAANEVLPMAPLPPSGAPPEVALSVPPLPPAKPSARPTNPTSPATPKALNTPPPPLPTSPAQVPPAQAGSPNAPNGPMGGPNAPGGPQGPQGPQGPRGPGAGDPGARDPNQGATISIPENFQQPLPPGYVPPPKPQDRTAPYKPPQGVPGGATPPAVQNPNQPAGQGGPPAVGIGPGAGQNAPPPPGQPRGADIVAAAQYLVDLASPAKHPSPIGRIALLRDAAALYVQAQSADSEGLTLAQKLELPSKARTAQEDADKALTDLIAAFDKVAQLPWVQLSQGNLKADWSSTTNYQHWKLLDGGEIQVTGGNWDDVLRSTRSNPADFVFECEFQTDDFLTRPTIYFREHAGAPFYYLTLGSRLIFLSYVKGIFTESHSIGTGDMEIVPKRWTALRVVFDGEHYIVAINGRVVIDARDGGDTSSGAPCLLSMHGTTLFRNLRIRELK